MGVFRFNVAEVHRKSIEAIRLIRDGEPTKATSTSTQFMSSESGGGRSHLNICKPMTHCRSGEGEVGVGREGGGGGRSGKFVQSPQAGLQCAAKGSEVNVKLASPDKHNS